MKTELKTSRIKFYNLANCSVIRLNNLFFVSTPSPEVPTIVLHHRKYYQTSLIKLQKNFTEQQWRKFLLEIPARKKNKVTPDNIYSIFEHEKKQVA